MNKFIVGCVTSMSFVFGAENDYYHRGNLNSQEKGDALYRDLDASLDDYHGGLWAGFRINNWDGILRPTVSLIEILNSNALIGSSSAPGSTSSGSSYSNNGSDQTIVNGKLYTHKLVRKSSIVHENLWATENTYFHTKKNIDSFVGWAKANWGTTYRGAFTSNYAEDQNILDSDRRQLIVDEAYRLYAADNSGWDYELLNMARPKYEWHGPWYARWYGGYWRGLSDLSDARCDFVAEWSYEKSGVMVWGNDASLRNIAYTGTSVLDYHNNAVENNDWYHRGELSPIVQSGDAKLNYVNTQETTTFRPSRASSPNISEISILPNSATINLQDKGSKKVYYSILKMDGSGLPLSYAKDESNVEIKYKSLNLGVKMGVYRSQNFVIDLSNFDLNSKYILVVTDEGGNTSEIEFQNMSSDVVLTILTPFLLS